MVARLPAAAGGGRCGGRGHSGGDLLPRNPIDRVDRSRPPVRDVTRCVDSNDGDEVIIVVFSRLVTSLCRLVGPLR